MFKFFRKYNKWLLAVGVTLLMIVFLIQPTLQMFQGNPAKQPIGKLRGQTVTVLEQREAGDQLRVLDSISPNFTRFTTQDPLQWLLMLREAEQLGVSASDIEVDEVVRSLGIVGADPLMMLARKYHVATQVVREAVRSWLIVQNYREVVLGLAHLGLQERMMLYNIAGELAQKGDIPDAIVTLQGSQGTLRVSEPLVRRFLQDQRARVRVSVVQVAAARYLSQVGGVDEKSLSDLFQRYKDKLPGEGEPYGLGYRTPDRVKLEYLAFPSERLLAKVSVDEAEILSYYDGHREQFRGLTSATQPAAAAPENPTQAARTSIVAVLRDQKAAALADRLVKGATAILARETSGMEETAEGYRVLPAGWKPMALSAVAEQLQKQQGFLPDVWSDQSQWLDRAALGKLPGIGPSVLPLDAQRRAALADYVFSAKEFSPGTDNMLAPRRLQVGAPSQVVVGPDGSRYIFRLIAAEPARSPKSLEEVRDRVAADARKVEAYAKLVNDRGWLDKLATRSLESIAKELDATVLQPPAFPRRSVSMSMTLEVPTVEGVGRDRAFVDRVFQLARRVAVAGGMDKATAAERCDAIPVDSKMSVFLVRLDEFTSMTLADFERMAQRPEVVSWIYQSIINDSNESPFSTDNLSKRVGFERIGVERKKGGKGEAAAEE